MPESPIATEVQKPEGQPSFERAPLEPPRSLGEAWSEFKSKVLVEDKTGARESKQVDLTKATPKQLKEWEETGEVSEPKPGKEPAEAKNEKAAPDGEGKGDGKQPAQTEAPQENKQPQLTSYDRLLERASKEPDFDKVVERLHEPFFPLSQEGHARFQTMAYAMRQISNGDDVLYFLARPENSSVAMSMQNAAPHKIAQVIHTISAELRFGIKRAAEEETRPRAPKPPAEVGGRGTTPDDPAADAVRRNDFRAAEAAWNARLKQRGR